MYSALTWAAILTSCFSAVFSLASFTLENEYVVFAPSTSRIQFNLSSEFNVLFLENDLNAGAGGGLFQVNIRYSAPSQIITTTVYKHSGHRFESTYDLLNTSDLQNMVLTWNTQKKVIQVFTYTDGAYNSLLNWVDRTREYVNAFSKINYLAIGVVDTRCQHMQIPVQCGYMGDGTCAPINNENIIPSCKLTWTMRELEDEFEEEDVRPFFHSAFPRSTPSDLEMKDEGTTVRNEQLKTYLKKMKSDNAEMHCENRVWAELSFIGKFKCVEGECIPKILVCDGVQNCEDGSDEFFCPLS